MNLGSAVYILKQLQSTIINNISLERVDKMQVFYAISKVLKELEKRYDDEQ
jgi:hypothetical protein